MPDIFAQVKVEGIDVTTLVNTLEILEFDDRASRVDLNFQDSELILSDVFHEGLSVEIDLGYQDAHGIVFKGMITSLRALMPARGQVQVEVNALNNMIKMSYEPQTKRWWNTTLSQVVGEVALAQGFLPGSVAPGADPMFSDTEPLQQVAETNLSFLYRLADAFGCKTRLVHSTGPDQLNFEATSSLLTQAPLDVTMQYNENLLDFYVGFDSYETSVNSDLNTTDPLTGDNVELSEEHAVANDAQWVPDPERIARLGEGAAFVTELVAASATKRATLADFWRKTPRPVGAAARGSSSQSGMFGRATSALGQHGRGRATGEFQLQPQKRITLVDVGGRWSGDWYVQQCRHVVNIQRNHYITEFECSR